MRITSRAVLAGLMVVLLATGCGGDSEPDETTGTTAVPISTSAATTTTSGGTTSPQVTPSDLGDRIGDTYLAALEDVVALLAARPEGPDTLGAVAELKESYVQVLVELGREREALAPADRTEVDGTLRARAGDVPSDLFAEFQAAVADYYDIDSEVAELVASFNIITQYANFELLAQQDPDEAARVLGD